MKRKGTWKEVRWDAEGFVAPFAASLSLSRSLFRTYCMRVVFTCWTPLWVWLQVCTAVSLPNIPCSPLRDLTGKR